MSGRRSIRTITESYHGLCESSVEDRIFTLCAALPCRDMQETVLDIQPSAHR